MAVANWACLLALCPKSTCAVCVTVRGPAPVQQCIHLTHVCTAPGTEHPLSSPNPNSDPTLPVRQARAGTQPIKAVAAKVPAPPKTPKSSGGSGGPNPAVALALTATAVAVPVVLIKFVIGA